MINRRHLIALVLACVLAGTTAVLALVTFDPDTGGFAGKGDVQTVFGWNNAQLQTAVNQNKISFVWKSTLIYDLVCQDVAGINLKGEWQRSLEELVPATLDGDGRKTKGQTQYTGFILGPASASGDAPTVGDECGDWGEETEWDLTVDGNGEQFQNGNLTSVEEDEDSGQDGALYVRYDNNPATDVQIYP
jgi:hypothetical protein